MIKPLNNCLIVELVAHTETKSGLRLAAKEEDKSLRMGVVKEVSDKITDINPDDKVVFGQYAYDKLRFNGKIYCFVDKDDIVGIAK